MHPLLLEEPTELMPWFSFSVRVAVGFATSVILDAGQPKTGATAIQNALVPPRDPLIGQGTLHPAPKHIPYVHTFLPVPNEDRDKIAQHTRNRMGSNPLVFKARAKEELALIRDR